MEFWFSSVKVITIVAVIVLGIALDLGAVTGDMIGFRYWKNPGTEEFFVILWLLRKLLTFDHLMLLHVPGLFVQVFSVSKLKWIR